MAPVSTHQWGQRKELVGTICNYACKATSSLVSIAETVLWAV